MKILYDWLKELVEFTGPPEELRSRLTLSGTAVESVEQTAVGPMLDAELTINRADCMSHYGIAREVSTIYRKPLKPIEQHISESSERATDAASVEIQAPELCGRFTARVIRGVKVQPSPDWLRKRLEALGHSSINNIVDATNYAMLETGQPMHAYDCDKVAGHKLVVRRALPKEKLRTLDGIERTLSSEICVIADGARAVGIAGVMGGAESEISFATRNILLEAAWFDAISVRRTSKALGLRTEASTRFERGCDPEMPELASGRCAELIQQLAGGEILSGVIDLYPGHKAPHAISLSRRELLRIMGADIPDAEIEAILAFLGFAPKRAKGSSPNSSDAVWNCSQPSWRADVTREIDLIEEVVRHYGLDKIPSRPPVSKITAARLPHAEVLDRLRERLVGLGYQEILSITLVDSKRDALFRAEGVVPVCIENPLAEDASVMRSSGLTTMVSTLERNINRGQKNLRLFEMGSAYRMNGNDTAEEMVLTLGATGLAREKSVGEGARDFELADLKGDLDRIGELAGGFTWKSGGPGWLHAARSAMISIGNGASSSVPSGSAGQLARGIADQLKLRQDVFLAEIPLKPFIAACEAARARLRYQPLSRFPAVERDFSLVLRDGIAFAQVREAIQNLRIAEIISIEAIDRFRGGQIPAGQYSLLVRVTFQSWDATLTEAQISGFSEKIVDALGSKLDASLRTA
jgi:phenylalanyl-tRNA synthetase beta chain